MEDSEDDLPWKESRRVRALREINRCLDRQKNLLAETGVKLEEPPILDFEPRQFDDEHKSSKQRALAKILKEKLGSEGHNKVEIKTCNAILDEVIK